MKFRLQNFGAQVNVRRSLLVDTDSHNIQVIKRRKRLPKVQLACHSFLSRGLDTHLQRNKIIFLDRNKP